MQEIIVGMIVGFAACAVTWRYMPKAAKRKMLPVLARMAGGLGWKQGAARFAAASAADCADSCGSCGGCGPKEAPPSNEFSITPEALRRTSRR